MSFDLIEGSMQLSLAENQIEKNANVFYELQNEYRPIFSIR